VENLDKEPLAVDRENRLVRSLTPNKLRIFFSLIPFFLFLVWLAAFKTYSFERAMTQNLPVVLGFWAGWAAATYVLLTLVLRVAENWRRSLLVRLHIFGAAVWVA